MKREMRNLLIALVLLAVSAHAASGTNDLAWLEPYNVVWDSQSTNAAGSMPCGGRDIGLNVWVENGDVLFYMQRSGSIAEDDEYLKLGRVRVRLTPNPFAGGAFRQELKLEEGLVEITGQTTNQGEPLTATLKIWTEIDRSIVHVEMDSNRGISVDAAYESWRLSDESLPVSGNRRRSCFTFDQYPGTITLSKDTVERVGDAVRFYHRNPNNAQAPGIMIAQQGLQAYTNQIGDDILGRTFGGMMLGDGFVAAGETNGVYQGLAFNAWHLASQLAVTNCYLRVVTHIAQTDGVAEWQTNLQSLVSASATDIESARTTVTVTGRVLRRTFVFLCARFKSDRNSTAAKLRVTRSSRHPGWWSLLSRRNKT